MRDLEIITTGNQLIQLQNTYIKTPMNLVSIHGFLFQGLREWAGQYRTQNSWKNGTLFCPINTIDENIQKYSDITCDAITKLHKSDKGFNQLAYGFAGINKTHPFRDGNGRTQREWLRQILSVNGYVMDLNNTQDTEMIKASYLACHNDHCMLENILKSCIMKYNDPLSYYRNIDHLAILSHDDNKILNDTINRYYNTPQNRRYISWTN